MAIAPGTKLGRYEIRSQLGKGGMGEVYRAHDSKLGRDIAIKILPADVAVNQERMRRFVQEARAAAALNHPNIAHVYEIDEADGLHFIAMEFIDGDTLREKIHRDKAPASKLLKYLTQVAEGLAKAHVAGIVHRDLKPDNIMITRDDYAKILDFGLAKLIETQRSTGFGDAAPSEVATALMAQQSLPGTVLGTVGYMSPEQAQGRVNEIDHRSDIFSFGCILYEVATGQRAFEGKDVLDSLHKIVHAPTPQIVDTNPTAPAELQRIVRRCLAKDPDKRYQSMKDVAIELEETVEELKRIGEPGYSTQTSGTHPPAREFAAPPSGAQLTGARSLPPETGIPIQSAAGTAEREAVRPTSSAEYLASQIKRHKYGSAVILVAVVIAAVTFGIYRLIGQKKSILSIQSAKFTRLTGTGKATGAAISPDGKWLVHVIDDGGQQSLWLRQVAIASSNTQVVPPAEVRYEGVAFSPDGNYVYYSVQETNVQRGILYQVPVLGGTARKLLTGVDSSVAFSHDGKQIAFFRFYGDEDRLMVANADGTGERQLAMRHGAEYFFVGNFSGVSWSPDGKTLASPVVNAAQNYMSVVTVSVESGQINFFTPQKWDAVIQVAWLADGKSILATAREQLSSPFQIWQISAAGEAHRITNDLNSYPNISLTADSSMLATVQTETIANIWVAPVNDSAHAAQVTQGRNFDSALSWTPDGKIVYASDADGSADLYMIDSQGGSLKQLTVNSRANTEPTVSPDGRYIVFASDRAVVPHIWRMDLDGGNPKQLTNQPDFEPHCSPDSQWVVYVSNSNKLTVWKVSVNGGQPVQLSDRDTSLPAFSQDGKLIASLYKEDPNSPVKLAILPVEGGQPIKTFALLTGYSLDNDLRWSTDGGAIVYAVARAGVANLWAQPFDGSPPKQLTNFTSGHIFWFDFSRDGKKLALSRGTRTSDVVLISGFK